MTPSEALQDWLPKLEAWRIDYRIEPLKNKWGDAVYDLKERDGTVARIRLQVGLDAQHQVRTVVHELAHIFLHSKIYGLPPYDLSKDEKELECDLVVMGVLNFMPVDGVVVDEAWFHSRNQERLKTIDRSEHESRAAQAIAVIAHLLSGGEPLVPEPVEPVKPVTTALPIEKPAWQPRAVVSTPGATTEGVETGIPKATPEVKPQLQPVIEHSVSSKEAEWVGSIAEYVMNVIGLIVVVALFFIIMKVVSALVGLFG